MASLLDTKTFRLRILRELAIILAVILSTYIIDIQLRSRIEQIDNTIISQNSIYGLEQYHKETFDLLNQHLRNIHEIRDEINRALPPTEDIREFLKILDTYAQKHGVAMNLSVGTAVVSPIRQDDVSLQTIAIDISVGGEVNAIRAYIGELEHLPYFFTINTIDEKRDPAKPAFRQTVISGTLWTRPEQTLTQRQQ